MPLLVSMKLKVGIASEAVQDEFLGYGGMFDGGVKYSPNQTVYLDKDCDGCLKRPVGS